MSDLNVKQKQAATYEGPYLLISAGPGTGKTKTLVARIEHLIKKQGYQPGQICCVTFTVKAANEMYGRLQKSLGSQVNRINLGTFHAIALKILEQNGRTVNILNEKEQKELIRSLINTKTPQSIDMTLKAISRHKNKLVDIPHQLETIFKRYTEKLKTGNLYDYDDLLLALLDEAKTYKVPPFAHILIDEFQDTNKLQMEIIKQLTAQNTHLTVVGDIRQSIYSFRGATPEIMTDFKTQFPGATEIILNDNYRSAGPVIKAAQTLFPEDDLLQTFTQNGTVTVIETLNDISEAELVAKTIEESVGGINMRQASEVNNKNRNESFKDFAVIYRTHHTRDTVERVLRDHALPFQVVGGGSLFEEPVIEEVIKSMRSDKVPSDQKPTKTMEWIEENVLKKDLTDKESSAIRDLKIRLYEYDSQKDGLKKFLEYIDKLKDTEFYDPRADMITLLTIHAAKGLEFKHVFIVGFENNILPLKNADIEEEKRLLYVAITRAKESVTLLKSQKRKGKETKDSPFYSMYLQKQAPKTIDPDMEKTKQKIAKQKLKKSQMRLF